MVYFAYKILAFLCALQGSLILGLGGPNIKEEYLSYTLEDFGKELYNNLTRESEWVVISPQDPVDAVITFTRELLFKAEDIISQSKADLKSVSLERAEELQQRLYKARETLFSLMQPGTDAEVYKTALEAKFQRAADKAGIDPHEFYSVLNLSANEQYDTIQEALNRVKEEQPSSEAVRQADYIFRNPFQALEYWFFVKDKSKDLVLSEQELQEVNQMVDKLLNAIGELGVVIKALKN